MAPSARCITKSDGRGREGHRQKTTPPGELSRSRRVLHSTVLSTVHDLPRRDAGVLGLLARGQALDGRSVGGDKTKDASRPPRPKEQGTLAASALAAVETARSPLGGAFRTSSRIRTDAGLLPIRRWPTHEDESAWVIAWSLAAWPRRAKREPCGAAELHVFSFDDGEAARAVAAPARSERRRITVDPAPDSVARSPRRC
jgi:hypothetical protein